MDKTAFYHLGLSDSKINNIENISTLEAEHGKEIFNLPDEEDVAEKGDEGISVDDATNENSRPSLDDM